MRREYSCNRTTLAAIGHFAAKLTSAKDFSIFYFGRDRGSAMMTASESLPLSRRYPFPTQNCPPNLVYPDCEIIPCFLSKALWQKTCAIVT
jgi:hypothetical protein